MRATCLPEFALELLHVCEHRVINNPLLALLRLVSRVAVLEALLQKVESVVALDEFGLRTLETLSEPTPGSFPFSRPTNVLIHMFCIYEPFSIL